VLALLRKKQQEEFERQQQLLGGIGGGQNTAPIFSGRQRKREQGRSQQRDTSKQKLSRSMLESSGAGAMQDSATEVRAFGKEMSFNGSSQ
jgi:hypothetical protein